MGGENGAKGKLWSRPIAFHHLHFTIWCIILVIMLKDPWTKLLIGCKKTKQKTSVLFGPSLK